MCGSLVLVVVSVSSLNVAIPSIQEDLGASGSELQWIIDSYALVFAGLLLPAGAIGDRYGRRGALLAGLVLFGVATIGAVTSQSAGQLVFWRGLTGAGAALIMPATLSIIATVFPAHERNKAIAIWAGFAGAGGALGLISSGLLLEFASWEAIFLVNVPIVVLMLIAVTAVVPTSKDETATPLDPVGSLLSIGGLVALVFAIIEGPEAGWTSTLVLVSFGLAVVLLASFVLWELRFRYPMLDPRFFRQREFSLGSVTITAAFFGIFGMFFVITQFFQFAQGHSPLEAAIRILPYAIVLLIVSPRSAVLAARYGARGVMTAGMIIASLGFVVLAMAKPDTTYVLVGSALVLVALGTGLLMPPATSALVVSLPPSKAGVGSAMNDTTREVGGAIGIAIVGSLMAIGYRSNLPEQLPGLTGEAEEAARDSIGGMLGATSGLEPEAAASLNEIAADAFSHGVRLGMLVPAGLLAATAVLIYILYPRRSSTSHGHAPDSDHRPTVSPAGDGNPAPVSNI